MDPIKVNLATFEYEDVGITYALYIIAALLVLGLSGYNIQLGIRNQLEIMEFEEKLAQLEEKDVLRQKIEGEKSTRNKKRDVAALKQGIVFVNRLIQLDVFPWEKLLDSLENSVPKGVIIMNFSTSEDFTKALLVGKTNSMKEIDAFLNKLDTSGIFKKNVLTNFIIEQKGATSNDSDQLKIRFQVDSTLDLSRLSILDTK